jgi:alpha-tubulin suppressor-like RCC1 family protein
MNITFLFSRVGCGDQDSHDEPICIKLYANQQRPPEIKGVACGWRHTFILLENGNLFSYGNNQYAQLGYDPRIKEFRENQVS